MFNLSRIETPPIDSCRKSACRDTIRNANGKRNQSMVFDNTSFSFCKHNCYKNELTFGFIISQM